MEDKQQTSVEWLFRQLWDEPKDKFTWYALLAKAKEKHEQEIINAGVEFMGTNFDPNPGRVEQYYNETYK
jgi:hypothetical protein